MTTLCAATIYSYTQTGQDRPCLNQATSGIFCYAHNPKATERREEKATAANLERQKVKQLRFRKLYLIPLLDECEKRARYCSGGLDDVSYDQGTEVVLDVIREWIREEV